MSLPKGGGAIKGIGEKFAANPVTGTGSLSIPLPLSPGRSGFTPPLALSYDSGAGNGPYGFGWSVGYPPSPAEPIEGFRAIDDTAESDVFILSGAEDLVPVLRRRRLAVRGAARRVSRHALPAAHRRALRPHRALEPTSTIASDTFWRSITRDNVTTFYGKTRREPHRRSRPTRRASSPGCSARPTTTRATPPSTTTSPRTAAVSTCGWPASATGREAGRSANRYLKRIKYGNRTSRLVEPDLSHTDWLFELVIDYGDHEAADPRPSTRPRAWPVRPDPFSSCRAGFEVRTYRRCQRVLMFHHFPELGPEPQLVRSPRARLRRSSPTRPVSTPERSSSTRAAPASGSFLRRARPHGLSPTTASRKSMPPLELTYSRPRRQRGHRSCSTRRAPRIFPAGVDGGRVPVGRPRRRGPLRRPHRAGRRLVLQAEPRRRPARRRSSWSRSGRRWLRRGARSSSISPATATLDLVELARPHRGLLRARRRTTAGRRSAPFARLPNIDWDDPNLRFVDLTGDGHADVLITEDDVISLAPVARRGRLRRRASRPRCLATRTRGPRLVFADATDTIFLADMSGDGLADLVRIRNGEVCYWPNLGYGRFGAKVTMDDAPVVRRARTCSTRAASASPTSTAPGTTDIIYLARRRRAALLQPVGQRLERAAPLAELPAGRQRRRRSTSSTCSATAPPASSGRRRCPATRGARCATST